jgi:dihydrolipoamide dehydrogenase
MTAGATAGTALKAGRGEKAKSAVVIGAGPGGYVAAIKLAQLGVPTTCVEKEALGGVCLNWGCIPSKAVIQASSLFEKAKKGAEMGIVCSPVADMAKITAWKDQIVAKQTSGVGQLFKGNKVEHLKGTARLTGRGREVEVDLADGTKKTLSPDAVIVSPGARVAELPGIKIDEKDILSSRGVLDLTVLPARMVVIGGGVIGLELGTALAKLGTKVTVVEFLDHILGDTDPELSRWVSRKMGALGMDLQLSSKVVSVEKKGGALEAVVQDADGKNERRVPCDKVLLAVGFKPNSEGLGLEKLGVALDTRGHILVNDRLETNVRGIYAIGDVTGMPYLAHRASRQGIVAAEVIAGEPAAYDVRAMPAATFTDPEIATVGLTEAQAKAAGYEVKVGKFPFAPNGRARAYGDSVPPGVVKIVADKASGVLLGVHICGHEASELISEAALAIEMGATAQDLALTVHPHPTLAEAVMEAAEGTVGKPIHILA